MVNGSMIFPDSTPATSQKTRDRFTNKFWSPLTISGTVDDKCCGRNDFGDEKFWLTKDPLFFVTSERGGPCEFP